VNQAVQNKITKVLTLLAFISLALGLQLFTGASVKASIANGAPAVDLLGQYNWSDLNNLTPDYTKTVRNDGPSPLGVSSVTASAVDSVNRRLYIADSANNRILVYALNSDGTLVDRLPDNVIGQVNTYSLVASATQSTFVSLRGLALDVAGQRLFASDAGGNRILVFNVSTITNGMSASNVLGQSNFTNATLGVTQSGLNFPQGLVYDSVGQRLFVADTNSNRVIVYDVASITNGENAVNVLGQGSFTTSTSGSCFAADFTSVVSLALDTARNHLFVGFSANCSRVLVHDVSAIVNGQDPINVLGQPDFFSNSAATTAAGLSGATAGLVYDATTNYLYVADVGNRRVVAYDVAAIVDGEDAVRVLGQPDFTTNTISDGQDKIGLTMQSLGLDATNQKLYVGTRDYYLVFDVASITNGENAVDMVGRYDATTGITDPQPLYTKASLPNNAVNMTGYESPAGMAMDTVGHRLFIVDAGNRRVLVYNLNTSNMLVDKIPDFVLGQPDFNSQGAATTQAGLTNPNAIVFDATTNLLYVSQGTTANRVSVFDVASITNGEVAVNVLGQSTFTTGTAATTQAGLNIPNGLAIDTARQLLFVSQSTANRVSVFDVASITNGEVAVNVLGQSTFTTGTAATTQAGLSAPQALALDVANNRLFVSQSTANRVSVFDVTSITDGEDAVNVLGQSLFTTSTAAVTQSGLSGPTGITYDSSNRRVFVVNANRVSVFDVTSITDGEDAVNVLGQSSFTTSTPSVSQSGLTAPGQVFYNAARAQLFVAQGAGAHRISIFDVSLANYIVSANTLVTREEGASATFTIVLVSSPASDVVFDITSSNPASVVPNPAQATFTSSNWNTPQTIGLDAPHDDNTISEGLTVTVSVNDGLSDDGYDILPDRTINVSVLDNDAPISTGGGSSSGPPPVTPTTPLVPDLISPPPSENPDELDETDATDESSNLEDQPEVCVIPKYPTTFIRFGAKNDTEQVKLLEQFLNLFIGTDLPVNGIYETQDRQAVIAFQERYQEEILTPWKLTQGTGYVYIKTLAKIKTLVESRCQ
jgi:sugar lactone lactonase YvrE